MKQESNCNRLKELVKLRKLLTGGKKVKGEEAVWARKLKKGIGEVINELAPSI